MKYLILFIACLSGFSTFAQSDNINGLMSMDLSFYPVKFHDVGVMVNPTPPNTQGPDEISMISFGGGINGGVIFPFEISDNFKTGIKLSAGVFGMQVSNTENMAETGYSMGITGRALAYFSYCPDDIGYGLVFGTKYNGGVYKNLTAILGAEVFINDQSSVMFFGGLNPLRWQYSLSNGETYETLKMNEIGITFIFYP